MARQPARLAEVDERAVESIDRRGSLHVLTVCSMAWSMTLERAGAIGRHIKSLLHSIRLP